jgi:hypothetical protein
VLIVFSARAAGSRRSRPSRRCTRSTRKRLVSGRASQFRCRGTRGQMVYERRTGFAEGRKGPSSRSRRDQSFAAAVRSKAPLIVCGYRRKNHLVLIVFSARAAGSRRVKWCTRDAPDLPRVERGRRAEVAETNLLRVERVKEERTQLCVPRPLSSSADIAGKITSC